MRLCRRAVLRLYACGSGAVYLVYYCGSVGRFVRVYGRAAVPMCLCAAMRMCLIVRVRRAVRRTHVK